MLMLVLRKILISVSPIVCVSEKNVEVEVSQMSCVPTGSTSRPDDKLSCLQNFEHNFFTFWNFNIVSLCKSFLIDYYQPMHLSEPTEEQLLSKAYQSSIIIKSFTVLSVHLIWIKWIIITLFFVLFLDDMYEILFRDILLFL